MCKFINYILLLGLSISVKAADIPDFEASYQLSINNIPAGELQRSLTTADNGLREFSSVTQANGLFALFKPDRVEESSQWRLVNNTVQPHYYLYQRTGGEKEKTMSVTFHWPQLHADIDDKKHLQKLKIEPQTLDKLVYQISLMRDLQDDRTEFSYRIADGGKLKTYQIAVLAEETITTLLGKVKTVKLTRTRNKPNDRQTTLWCAPALHYLPVKLEHHEKGYRYTAVLKQLSGFETQGVFISTPKQPPFSPHGKP